MISQIFPVIMDLALGAAAFKLAWSVDRSQKAMAELLKELTHRVTKLEERG